MAKAKREDLIREMQSAQRRLKQKMSKLSNAISNQDKTIAKHIADVSNEWDVWCRYLRELVPKQK